MSTTMSTDQFNITSLFQPNAAATTIKRKDSGSGLEDVTAQLNSFKGFGEKTAPSKYDPHTKSFESKLICTL